MYINRRLKSRIDGDIIKQQRLYRRFVQEIINIKEEIYTNKECLDATLEPMICGFLMDKSIHNKAIMSEIKAYIYDLLNQSIDVVRDALLNKYININMEFDQQAIPLFDSCEASTITLTLQEEKIRITSNSKYSIQEYVDIFHELVYIENPDILADATNYNWHTRLIDNHEDSLIRKLRKRKKEDNIFEETLIKASLENILHKIEEVVHGDFVETDGHLEFKENGIREPLRLSNLSTGLKSFVLIKRLIEDGYIKKKGIIVLDEPEVHLHPKWQLLYAEILVILQKEFDLNIILTSHSPYFINAIEVFSAKYEVANNCKYYLSDVVEDRAIFEDVTTNIDD